MQLESEKGRVVLHEDGWEFVFREDRRGRYIEVSYGYQGSEIDPEYLETKRRKALNALNKAGYETEH